MHLHEIANAVSDCKTFLFRLAFNTALHEINSHIPEKTLLDAIRDQKIDRIYVDFGNGILFVDSPGDNHYARRLHNALILAETYPPSWRSNKLYRFPVRYCNYLVIQITFFFGKETTVEMTLVDLAKHYYSLEEFQAALEEDLGYELRAHKYFKGIVGDKILFDLRFFE